MTFKTRIRKIWEDPFHPAWIILAMAELLVLVLCFNRFVLERYSIQAAIGWGRPYVLVSYFDDANLLLGSPFMGAGGVRAREGIALFAGKPTAGVAGLELWIIGISLVLAYVAAPTLLLTGLKMRKSRMAGGSSKRSSFFPLIASATGGYVVCIALLFPAVTAPGSWMMLQRINSDNYANSVRDNAANAVAVMAFRAQLLRLMPEARGGGPWVNAPGGITIDDLESVLPSLERVLVPPGEKASIKYFLKVESQDSLTIWAVGNARGVYAFSGGPNFRNVDSTTGNVQIHAGVAPDRVMLLTDN